MDQGIPVLLPSGIAAIVLGIEVAQHALQERADARRLGGGEAGDRALVLLDDPRQHPAEGVVAGRREAALTRASLLRITSPSSAIRSSARVKVVRSTVVTSASSFMVQPARA
jgi:hypothetical protein